MTIQFDRVIIPSGLIRSAKTYTLIIDQGVFTAVHVGPAGNEVRTPNALAKVAVKKVYEVIEKKVVAGEKRLKEHGMEAMLQEKYSFRATKAEVSKLEAKKNFAGEPLLHVVLTNKKSYKFLCKSYDVPKLEAAVSLFYS